MAPTRFSAWRGPAVFRAGRSACARGSSSTRSRRRSRRRRSGRCPGGRARRACAAGIARRRASSGRWRPRRRSARRRLHVGERDLVLERGRDQDVALELEAVAGLGQVFAPGSRGSSRSSCGAVAGPRCRCPSGSRSCRPTRRSRRSSRRPPPGGSGRRGSPRCRSPGRRCACPRAPPRAPAASGPRDG